MDGILGRIDVVINGPTPDLSSHLINYDGRSHSRLRVGRERDGRLVACSSNLQPLLGEGCGKDILYVRQVLCSPVKIRIRYQTVEIRATTPELRVNTVNG